VEVGSFDVVRAPESYFATFHDAGEIAAQNLSAVDAGE
jgi:hypothetical protein